jgi:hypothetical protein
MPTCFVVMGFGEKTDLATGCKLNLDMTYRNIIQPALQVAGYACERADEIRHSSVIDIPMYEKLLSADLVVPTFRRRISTRHSSSGFAMR